ncbi:hypothetical protein SKAU_G00003530 [Synaphobranchus kaupii]|uniref:Uncharacterized protein n=1 Tax=Synaphobranchus kaupii TaxID=118154 RepID=A0A9Q1JC97_SYNKA|nr:hypothetical protein SKAU_G00003530 [Synaphobranchus kaupii]
MVLLCVLVGAGTLNLGSLAAGLYAMLSGRYTGVLRRSLTVNKASQDGTCGPLAAQGSRCSLQQRPCTVGEDRSQRRLQKTGETDGTAAGVLIQVEEDNTAEQLCHVTTAPGQGQGQWTERPHRPDPAVDSQERSRCLMPCGDKAEEGETREETGESTSHRGASTSATLHLYLPSPFYDEEGEKEKDQLDTRCPTGLPQKQENTDTKTVLPSHSRTGPRHGVAKPKKSAADRAMPALGQDGKLSAGSRNTANHSRVPVVVVNCFDPAGGTALPAPAPSPQRPLQEEDGRAQVNGPPCCPAPSRLVWRPSKAKDNYYERAVLTKATDHIKLKTITTLEWGSHGPQENKTVFVMQALSGRPAFSLCRATTSVSGHGGDSQPSSTQSCARTDL